MADLARESTLNCQYIEFSSLVVRERVVTYDRLSATPMQPGRRIQSRGRVQRAERSPAGSQGDAC